MARKRWLPEWCAGGTSVIVLMTVGIVGGIIADMMWNSLGLPGYNVPLQGCDTLTFGDAIQIGGTGALTFVGFLTKSKDIPAFTFGLMMGGIFPKIITKAFGLHDIDYLILIWLQVILPRWQLRGTPLLLATGSLVEIPQ